MVCDFLACPARVNISRWCCSQNPTNQRAGLSGQLCSVCSPFTKTKILREKNSDIWINSCPQKTSHRKNSVHILNSVQVKLHHSVFIWTPAVCRPEKEKTPIQVIFIKIKIAETKFNFFLPKSRPEKKSIRKSRILKIEIRGKSFSENFKVCPWN